jgi:nicotinate-nucleotide--dimethylbenzimidazole phosphoribosyltransferase
LRRLGGREFAAIAGAIIAARFQRIPVLLDGFVTCAAAAILHKAEPTALDHCLAAHRSGTPAHDKLLNLLGKKPLLDFGIAREDGTGAALAIPLLKGAATSHTEMATRDQLGIHHDT